MCVAVEVSARLGRGDWKIGAQTVGDHAADILLDAFDISRRFDFSVESSERRLFP